MIQARKLIALMVVVAFATASFLTVASASTSETTNSSPYSSLLSSYSLSESLTNSNVMAIQQVAENYHWNFLYNDSLSVLEAKSSQALQAIENSVLFLTSLSSYSGADGVYLTQGESYDFVTQEFNFYLVITIPILATGEQTALTFTFSEGNNSVYGPSVAVEPIAWDSQTEPSGNWAGYEFYDPGTTIEENYATVVIPTITLSSNPSDYNEATAGWIGLSPYEGGTDPANPNATNLIQTGFQRIFLYDDVTGGYNWGSYTTWYQTWSNGTSPAYSGGYPGMPAPSSGSDIAFGFEYDGLSGDYAVTYAATTLNNSYTYTVSTPYYNTPNYAQYIIEAPLTTQEGWWIQSQISEFESSVTFASPTLLTGESGFINLNGLVSDGYYNDFIMNQSWGHINQNIDNTIISENGYDEPQMTWVNSNWDSEVVGPLYPE